MAEAAATLNDEAREAAVVSKAVVRAADTLEISSTVLARILGLSPASVSRLRRGTFTLAPGDKSWELALQFVRLFRGLDAIAGGDDAVSRAWLRNPNRVLRGTPLDLVQTVPGLVAAVMYVDSRRARV